MLALVLTDSGRWVPSPASDIVVLIFGVAATSYLLDALSGHCVPLSTSSALVAGAAAGSTRQLGWVTAVATGVVLAFQIERELPRAERIRAVLRNLLPGTLIAATLFVTMLARDAILTGWLFPDHALNPDHAAAPTRAATKKVALRIDFLRTARERSIRKAKAIPPTVQVAA